MKFLLSIENHPILSGYQIISPLEGKHPLKLDMIDDAEASEIICDNILNYVPLEHIYPYITLLSKKLTHGGKLIIVSDDILSINSEFYHGRISTLQFNQLIFGPKNTAWGFKQSAVSLDEISQILNELSLKVITKKLHNLKFSITCQRN